MRALRETSLAALLSHIKPLLYSPNIGDLHKLDALERVLKDHEGFRKAIVFVNRVIVVKALTKLLRKYKSIVIYGRTKMKIYTRRVFRKG